MAFLTARNLNKTYRISRRNVVHALRGVGVTIEAGEMVAIAGPSGSGKSTLMHILGLLHSPDAGSEPPPSLVFDGMDVTSLPDRDRTRMRAERIGFVFQAFNLVPTLTALENVALPAEYAGLGRKDARAAAGEALELMGIADRAGHQPVEMSGGQQQRVAIARALVNEPSLLLADEPTGNLDTQNTVELLELLRRYNAERRQTMVLVTHDPLVSEACGRVLTMRDGAILEV